MVWFVGVCGGGGGVVLGEAKTQVAQVDVLQEQIPCWG